MHIGFAEIRNFRKLKSVRVDFAEKTTLFVGANNSGKTSAMVALGHFLVDPKRFTTNDFTLSNWVQINQIGERWVQADASAQIEPSLQDWEPLLPSLDMWLNVAEDEVHYVNHLLPLLTWSSGLLGVRLRLEPKDLAELQKEYLLAVKDAIETKSFAEQKDKDKAIKVSLWPESLSDYLERRLKKHFVVHAYLLDPSKCKDPVNGVAQPQHLLPDAVPVEGDPFEGLIRIDEINAQRGFSDVSSGGWNAAETNGTDRERSERRRLSEQLRAYYAKHLDPSEFPEPSDLAALEAIETAQSLFNERLRSSFSAALDEVEGLGYPGVTDPKLTISTRIRPTDGLNHQAAVQYEVISQVGEAVARSLRLPEEYNGLGYQNLISMVFRLMAFRDAWMEVGKAAKRVVTESERDKGIAPLHFVLVEEPEAHLHAQVQQVFIRKAYDILRAHKDLGADQTLKTQLIVSTHSSHVAHECDFAGLRYFRRLPARVAGEVPTTTVINCSEVFGKVDETQKFVSRYLRATHCDLFFADAAILVEGPVERMLIPHFIRNHYRKLDQCYLTILEIGGSHAHRLRPLIEHLGLITLVITDIDAASGTGKRVAQQPQRKQGQVTRNSTLRGWVPSKSLIDELLDLRPTEKAKQYDPQFSVRAAYQIPIMIPFSSDATPAEAISNTFEDALVFENIPVFKNLEGDGAIQEIREAIAASKSPDELGSAMFSLLKTANKAKLALDVLYMQEPNDLNVPTYIAEGLDWLQQQLDRKQKEAMSCVEPVDTAKAA